MEEEKLNRDFEFQQEFEDEHPQDLILTDYLFEPDITKLKDISDFDVETDWISRIDRFGAYVGDGILSKRSPITKVVFHGFYEDLTEDVQVYRLADQVFTFHDRNQPISIKKLELPVQVMCYNADVLISEDGREIKNSDVWITPLLDMGRYSVQDKFMLQCFELIRLTRIPQNFAEKMKVMSILCASGLNLTKENFQTAAASLFFYFETHLGNEPSTEIIDKIEWPIFYGFSKGEILCFQEEFEKILKFDDYQRYEQFQLRLAEILESKTDHLQIELYNYLDPFYGEKIYTEYVKLIENVENDFLKLYLFGEFVVGLSRVLPSKVLAYYNSVGCNLIENNSAKLKMIEDLRLLLIKESLLLYDDFIWGPALIFNILGFHSAFKNTKNEGLAFLIKVNAYLQNHRDYIQFLFSYLELLNSIGEIKFTQKILNKTSMYLKNLIFPRYPTLYTYNQFLYFSQFVISQKLLLNQDIRSDIAFIINYILNAIKAKSILLASLPPEIENNGLEILKSYDFGFTDEELRVVIRSRSSELFLALYNLQVMDSKPNFSMIIRITSYFLCITKNLLIYSLIFPKPMDYSRERLKFYFNLFIFYKLENDEIEYSKNVKDFLDEFTDKIDPNLFSEIKAAIINRDHLENFLINNNQINDIDIDKSLIFYLKIKLMIIDYLESKDLEDLIMDINQLLPHLDKYQYFRTNYKILQILYRLILRDKNRSISANSVIDKINQLQKKHNITEKENFVAISDAELQEFLIQSEITQFICPII